MKKLVIVESPAKAKKISSFLGSNYIVKSSIGHVRDLPIPSKIPAAQKEKFGKFAVDVDNDFEPYYAILPGKTKVVSELKSALKECDELFLATDEDREGEAIAWHLCEILKPKVPVKRMVFHEITKEAIQEALTKTRSLDLALVDAQESRRIVDRLFGYELSPILWRKYGPGLSAGRVQSVAVRLIVEREKDRIKFIKKDYASLFANLADPETGDIFSAKLVSIDDKKVAVSKDFDDSGNLVDKSKDALILTPEIADSVIVDLPSCEFLVASISKKPHTKTPKAPFTTSSMQIEAGNRLHWSSATVMRIAQQLYENGYITYMRTDSPILSTEALTAARKKATEMFGKENVLPEPKQYGSSSKNAQEAHEAIRPAGTSWPTPDELALQLDGQQLALYDLIFRRTIASQMVNAKGWTTTYQINAENGNDKYTFSVGGTVIADRGFLLALDEFVETAENEGSSNSENDDSESTTTSQRLPDLKENSITHFVDANSKEHQTKPSARFTEPTLVRELERLGIGRPSTYAATIETILNRGYVFKKGSALVPRWLTFAVVSLLETEMDRYVDYQFTAKMEDDLDKIATKSTDKLEWMKTFYFGENGLHKNVTEVLERHKNEQFSDDVFELPTDKYQVHLYRSNAYVEQKGASAQSQSPKGRIPDDLPPDELDEIEAQKLVEAGAKADEPLGLNPETGYPIIVKTGKYGPFFTEVLPEGVPTKGKGAVKPKIASLLKTWEVDKVTLEDALQVFQLPITLGINPADNQEIKVNNGMFGPYLAKNDVDAGKIDYRSIKKTDDETAEERMFTITLEEAIEIYSQPKVYRGRGGSRRGTSTKKK